MKVCAPITKCYGTNVRSSGKKNQYIRTLPQMEIFDIGLGKMGMLIQLQILRILK